MKKVKKRISIFLASLIFVTSIPVNSFAYGLEKIKENKSEMEARESNKENTEKEITDVNESTSENTAIEVLKEQELSKEKDNQMTFDFKSDLRLQYKKILEDFKIENNQKLSTRVLEKSYENFNYNTRSKYSITDSKEESPIKLSLEKKNNVYINENKAFVDVNVDKDKTSNDEIESYILILQKTLDFDSKVYKNDDLAKINSILQKLDELETSISKSLPDTTTFIEKTSEFNKLLDDLNKIQPIYNLADYGLRVDQKYTENQKKYLEKHKTNPEKYPLKYDENYYSIKLVKDEIFSGKIPSSIKLAFSFNERQIYHGDLVALEFNTNLKDRLNENKNIIFSSILSSDLLTDSKGEIQKKINEDKEELETIKSLIDFEQKQDELTKSTINIDNKTGESKTDNVDKTDSVDDIMVSLTSDKKEWANKKMPDFLLKDVRVKESMDNHVGNIHLKSENNYNISYKDVENSLNSFVSGMMVRSFYSSNNNITPSRLVASETAKLIINKKDENGSSLKNAKFRLSGKLLVGETYSVEKLTGDTGLATFDDLQPGNYILEEVLAPENYKKINTKWYIYVSPNGAIFVNEKKDNVIVQPSTGVDVSDKITGTISIDSDSNVKIGDGKTINIKADLKLNGVKENDFFDVKFSPNIHYNMLQFDKPNQPIITDQSGKIIATPRLIKTTLGGEKIIRYTFTDFINDITGDLTFSMHFGGYSIDYYYAKKEGNQNLEVKIGSIVGSKDVYITFSGPSVVANSPNNPVNLDALFYYTNDQNGKYTQLVYVNPLKRNMNTPTTLEISPYTIHNSSDYTTDHIVANIDPKNTTIRIYKLKDSNTKFNQAVVFEEELLTDVTNQFNGKIKIENGRATISFPNNVNTDSYLVKIDSNMKYPVGLIQGTFLVQMVKLIDSTGAYPYKYSSIGVESGGSYGTGSSFIKREVTLDVKNEKIKNGLFIINKKSDKGTSLDDAEFTLKRIDKIGITQDVVLKTINGSAKFENLAPGTYRLSETKAPTGYEITNETWTVYVYEDGSTKIVKDIEGDSKISFETVATNDSLLNKSLDKLVGVRLEDGVGYKVMSRATPAIRTADEININQYTNFIIITPYSGFNTGTFKREVTLIDNENKIFEVNVTLDGYLNGRTKNYRYISNGEITEKLGDNFKIIDNSVSFNPNITVNKTVNEKSLSISSINLATKKEAFVLTYKVQALDKNLTGNNISLIDASSYVKANIRHPETNTRDVKVSITKILPDIISSNEILSKPAGYVTVEFKPSKGTTLSGTTKYYVNPNKSIKLSQLIYPTINYQSGYKAGNPVWNSEINSEEIINRDLVISTNPVNIIDEKPINIPILTVLNKKLRPSFEIEKVDSKNNNIKLENAIFTLTKLEKTGNKSDVVYEKTTTTDGKVQFNNLDDGSYILEEKKSPEGYLATFNAKKILVKDGKVYQYIQKDSKQDTIPDKLKKAKSGNGFANITGKIVNVDEKNNTFTYRIYANDWIDSRNPVYFYYDYENPTVNVKSSSNVSIDSIIVRKVPGSYALDERYLPKTNIENFNSGLFYDFNPMVNINKTNNIAILKFGNIIYNGYKYQLLNDASLPVIDVTGRYIDQTKIDLEASFSYTTRDLVVHSAIINNSYTEAKTSNQEEIQEISKYEPLIITNKKEDLIFEKVESGNKNIKLNGVRFELRNKSGGLIKEYISNQDGKISIDTSTLHKGDYSIHEVKTLEGYKLPENSEVGKFTIAELGKVINIFPQDKIITNTPLGENKIKVTKKDEKNIAMSDVEFKLIDSDGHTVDVKKTNSSGEIVFDNLPFGEYSLIELKTKDGYILESKPKKILIGKDFEIPQVEGRNVSDRVISSNGEIMVDGKSQDIIKPRAAEQIIVRNTLQFGPDIKPGDYFIIDYSDNVDVGGLTPNNLVDLNIVGTAGLLAKGEWIQDTHSVKYTFTEYISNYRVNEAKLTTYIYIDFDTVKKSGYQLIEQKIDKKTSISKNLYVDYKDLVLYDDISGLGSSITEYNDVDSSYKHIVYINPYGSRKNYGNKAILTYMFDTDGNKNSSAIVNNTTNLSLYYVNDLSGFAESYSFDTNNKYKLKEGVDYIRRNYNGSVEIEFIKYKPIDGNRLAMVVDGRMTKNSGKPLNPSAKLYNTWIEYDDYGYGTEYSHWRVVSGYVTKQENESESEGDIGITINNFPNSIEFTKVDISDKERKDFSGVSFELRYSSSEDGVYEKLPNSEKITTKEGKISYNKLKSGFYKLFETKAWQGYKLPNKAVAKFEVNSDGEIVNVTPENRVIENSKAETDIEFVKIDGKTKNNNEPTYLEAEFTLFKWDKQINGEGKYIEYKNKYTNTNQQTNEKYSVKSDKLTGRFKFEGLEDGKYAVKETKAPISKDGISYIKPNDYIVEFLIEDAVVVDILYKNATFGDIKKVSKDGVEKLINYVYNYKSEYPQTGGDGSLNFHYIGISMMVISLLYIYFRKKCDDYISN